MTVKLTIGSFAIPVIAVSIFFSACTKSDNVPVKLNNLVSEKGTAFGKAAPKGTEFYALTSTNMLVKYSSGNPLSELDDVAITGLQSMERVLAIDFRPATGQLYGVTNQNRLYVINQVTGVAVAVSPTPFSPAISGTEVGFDFNPTVDRIRVVTSSDQNFRLNPETGMVAGTDGSINPAGTTVTAVAYTNSFSGATSTTLYDIDVESDKLFIQSPPGAGRLVEVGSLGVQAVGEAGFDIAPDNSVAIAALFGRGLEAGQTEESNGNKYRFYYINLATGEATNAGKTEREIIGVAIPTNPVAYAVNQMNQLLIFNPELSSGIITKAITGLQSGEMVLGIDMRPATAQLYALGSSNRIYAINMANGVATAIGAVPFTPALSGTSFGFDFNPTVDRIRVVSNTGQNLRLNPITGAVAAVDPMLNPGTPSVDGAGYRNSFAGATVTELYDVDFASDKLYEQNPANAGTLVEVGSLGIDITSGNGFDLGGRSDKGWGIFTVAGTTSLYTVDLDNGMSTATRIFPSAVRGLAIGLGF